MTGHARMIALLPVLILVVTALYAYALGIGDAIHPLPGRGAEILFLAFGLLGIVLLWRAVCAGPSRSIRLAGCALVPPWWFFGVAMLWQAVCTLTAEHRGVATLHLAEHAGVLITALAIAAWQIRQKSGAAYQCAWAGIILLLIPVIGQIPIGDRFLAWAIGWGQEIPFGNNNFNVGAALLLAVVLLPWLFHDSVRKTGPTDRLAGDQRTGDRRREHRTGHRVRPCHLFGLDRPPRRDRRDLGRCSARGSSPCRC